MPAKNQRLEYCDEKSSKFWEIVVDGSSYTITYGRIGTRGQNKVKSFVDAEASLADAEKQVAAKCKKGYEKVAADAAKTVVTTAQAKALLPTKAKSSPKTSEQSVEDWYFESQRQDVCLEIGNKQAPIPQPAVVVSPSGTISLVWASVAGVGHRYYDGKTWHDEMITRGNVTGIRAAYAADGRLHVIYDDRSKRVLLHAVKEDEKWVTTNVTMGPSLIFNYTCFGISPSGQPFLTFSNEDHFLARLEGKTWVATKLDMGDFIPRALLVIKDGVHLLGEKDGHLQHAVQTPDSEWHLEKAGENKHYHGFPSLAGDPTGGLHVVYMGGSSKDRAMYVTKGESGWSEPEMIHGVGNNGFGNVIHVDSTGTPHVIFRIQKSRALAHKTSLDLAQLLYASKRGDEQWQVCQLQEEIGWHCDLAIGPDNVPWVTYRQNSRGGICLGNPARQTLAVEAQPKVPQRRNILVEYEQAVSEMLRAGETLYMLDGGYCFMNTKPEKFWELQIVASEYTIRYGKIGSNGRQKTKDFESPEKALNAGLKQLYNKISHYHAPDLTKKYYALESPPRQYRY